MTDVFLLSLMIMKVSGVIARDDQRPHRVAGDLKKKAKFSIRLAFSFLIR